MKVIIQSPDGIDKEIQNVESLSAFLSNGYPISILSNHAPLIAQISAGVLKYKISTTDHTISLPDSILFVRDNLVRILTTKMHLMNNDHDNLDE
jgi:F0F1-type ATP synthase epsilon subunit